MGGLALSRLARRGAVWRFGLAYSTVVWCAAPRLGCVLASCGGRVVRIGVRELAEAAIGLVERGARAIRPSRLAPCRGGAVPRAILGILRATLDGVAEEDWRGSHRVFLVRDPGAAVERLKRIIESGALPLGPDPP